MLQGIPLVKHVPLPQVYLVSGLIKGTESYCCEECMDMVIAGGVKVTFHGWESPNGTNESRGQVCMDLSAVCFFFADTCVRTCTWISARETRIKTRAVMFGRCLFLMCVWQRMGAGEYEVQQLGVAKQDK